MAFANNRQQTNKSMIDCMQFIFCHSLIFSFSIVGIHSSEQSPTPQNAQRRLCDLANCIQWPRSKNTHFTINQTPHDGAEIRTAMQAIKIASLMRAVCCVQSVYVCLRLRLSIENCLRKIKKQNWRSTDVQKKTQRLRAVEPSCTATLR